MSRRTTVLTATAVLACLLFPTGVALLVSGISSGHDARTVVGIALTLVALICLRVLTWARRIRLMTEAGMELHCEEPPGSSQNGRSG
jgi:hypothetical protein